MPAFDNYHSARRMRRCVPNSRGKIVTKRRGLFLAATVIAVLTIAGILWAKGRRDVLLNGTLQ